MIKKIFIKTISLLLVIGLNWAGISAIGSTWAYFNDTETSEGNSMAAGVLDFALTNQNVSGFVGMENNGEIFHTSVAIPESGSMPMRYFAYSTSTSSICSEFRVIVKQNKVEIFNGPLPDFLSATTAVFGTWKFEFDLPVGVAVTQGDLCQANITFSAWREEIENPEESGFFDIEILSLNLKAKTIVLNEVLANPNDSHPYPANKEFIELKNNGNAPVDVAGWKVSEMTAGGAENKYTITTAGGSHTASPYGGSTIIPAGGWLVLLLSGGTALNNNGDTIRLYDSGDNKLDEYSYEVAKYGMSDARYPDGIGTWVDPIPTPGGMNVLEDDNIYVASGVTQEERVVAEKEVLVEPIEEIIPEVIPEVIPEEQAVVKEQPAMLPNESDSNQDGVGENDNNSSIDNIVADNGNDASMDSGADGNYINANDADINDAGDKDSSIGADNTDANGDDDISQTASLKDENGGEFSSNDGNGNGGENGNGSDDSKNFNNDLGNLTDSDDSDSGDQDHTGDDDGETNTNNDMPIKNDDNSTEIIFSA